VGLTRFKLVLEYDGKDFVGWQLQPGQRSVQSEVEAALEKLCGHPIRVHAAGRTDSGVHALDQCAHFDTSAERTPRDVLRGLNGSLPADVAVVSASVAPEGFDARQWSWGKVYRYRFLGRSARSPIRRHRVWNLRTALDAEAMNAGAQHWLGEHDLSSFRARLCMAATPVRKIKQIGVNAVGDEVHLEVHGIGFLRHMVRIMAGTLADIGRGKRPPEWAGQVLEARSRQAAGKTAPAHGLELRQTLYGDGPPPWKR